MENKNEGSAVDSFLGDLATQQDAFSQSQEDLFASPTEEQTKIEPEVKEESEEKSIPFHKLKKDPSFQRFLEKEISKKITNTTAPSATEQFVNEVTTSDDPLIDSFKEIIGDDTPEKRRVLKEFKERMSSIEENAARRAKEEFKKDIEREREAEREAQEYLESQFEEIEETFNVDMSSNSPQARKTRNEFIDFVTKIAPKDSSGEIAEYPDLIATFEIFNERKQKPVSNRAKELAERGIARSAEATTSDKPRVTWDNIDTLLGRN